MRSAENKQPTVKCYVDNVWYWSPCPAEFISNSAKKCDRIKKVLGEQDLRYSVDAGKCVIDEFT